MSRRESAPAKARKAQLAATQASRIKKNEKSVEKYERKCHDFITPKGIQCCSLKHHSKNRLFSRVSATIAGFGCAQQRGWAVCEYHLDS
jgi:hypothetical protein